MSRQYTIILDPNTEEGRYTVTVPALPGCVTQGATLEQCVERAKEAITAWIADAETAGDPIPEEIERPQAITIQVAA